MDVEVGGVRVEAQVVVRRARGRVLHERHQPDRRLALEHLADALEDFLERGTETFAEKKFVNIFPAAAVLNRFLEVR